MKKLLLLFTIMCNILLSQKEIDKNLTYLQSKDTKERFKGFKYFFFEMDTNKLKKMYPTIIKTLGKDSGFVVNKYILKACFKEKMLFNGTEKFSINDHLLFGDTNAEQRIINKFIELKTSNNSIDNQITFLSSLMPTKEVAEVVAREFLYNERFELNYIHLSSYRYYYLNYLTKYFNKDILKIRYLELLSKNCNKNTMCNFTDIEMGDFIKNELKLDSSNFKNIKRKYYFPKFGAPGIICPMSIKSQMIIETYFLKITEKLNKEFNISYNPNYKMQSLFLTNECTIKTFPEERLERMLKNGFIDGEEITK